MKMTEWAEREVNYAIEQEKRLAADDKELEYGAACYQSALRAFKSLAKDGHSAFSMAMTKNILNRLLDGKPLTPIDGTDAIWEEYPTDNSEERQYQCSRLYSLFKHVKKDGSVSFYDVDRVRGTCKNSSIYFSNGFLTNFVNELFPITLPYMPEEKPYVMLVEEFLFDPKNGDFDTIGYLQLTTPNGEVQGIYRYFKDDETGDSYIEITAEEYAERKRKCVEGTLM